MTMKQNVVVHFKEIPVDNGVRNFVEERCALMLEEFPELSKLEVSLSPDGNGFTAHAHATGRKTDVAATHDWEQEVGHAADQVLTKVHKQLRKKHDKRTDHRRHA